MRTVALGLQVPFQLASAIFTIQTPQKDIDRSRGHLEPYGLEMFCGYICNGTVLINRYHDPQSLDQPVHRTNVVDQLSHQPPVRRWVARGGLRRPVGDVSLHYSI